MWRIEIVMWFGLIVGGLAGWNWAIAKGVSVEVSKPKPVYIQTS